MISLVEEKKSSRILRRIEQLMYRSFPSWSYFHYRYLSIFQEISPGMITNIDRINEQLNRVFLSIKNEENYLKIIEDFNKQFDSSGGPNEPNNINSLIEKIQLLPQEFTTTFSANKGDYLMVSDEAEALLGIPKEQFTIDRLLGRGDQTSFIIPRDIHHFTRFGLCSYLVTSAYGFMYKPITHIYEVRFRIIAPLDKKMKVISKKSFLAYFHQPSTKDICHVDVWQVSDITKGFRKVEYKISMPEMNEMSVMQNQLIAICNARILGFSPKEVFYLNHWYTSGNINALSARFAEYFDINDPKAHLKSCRDFIYKLKRKIIQTALSYPVNVELDPEELDRISNSNPLFLADEMGLLDFNETTLSLIADLSEAESDSDSWEKMVS
ncbi:MAG: hypothetical protein P8P74_11380 [Crocinitomicaceae bacterium]|nr:hypothetical protein [Crocinitomicaceae bacterium]